MRPNRDPQQRGRRASGPLVLFMSGMLVAAACGGKSEGSGNTCVMTVYAQNRWQPYGAAIRSGHDLSAPQVAGVAGNHTLIVDGYVHTGKSVYPQNVEPFNSDTWLRVEDPDQPGTELWVSFAGVRKAVTENDPTGLSTEGGEPVPLQPACEIHE